MNFITVRDLRLQSGQVWKKLKQTGEMVLTSNGKPIAILSAVQDEDLEETLSSLRQARATLALSKLRQSARRKGQASLKEQAIQSEIKAVRRTRKR